MALVATQVGQLRTQLLAPGDGAAVVAGVAGVQRVAHLWQQAAHPLGVAPKAVARQQHAVAAELLQLAIRAHKAQTQQVVGVVHIQRAHLCFGQHHHTRRFSGIVQTHHQTGAGFFGHGMHAVHAVAGVQKRVEHLPRHTVVLCQRVHSRANGAAVGVHQHRRRTAMGFGLNVLRQQRRRIADALRLLRLGGGCRHKARRQGGRPGGQGITLQHHAVHAQLAQGERSGEAASTAAHNGHRRVHRRGEAGHAFNRGAHSVAKNWAQVITSATDAMSVSAAWWAVSEKVAQPSLSTTLR